MRPSTSLAQHLLRAAWSLGSRGSTSEPLQAITSLSTIALRSAHGWAAPTACPSLAAALIVQPRAAIWSPFSAVPTHRGLHTSGATPEEPPAAAAPAAGLNPLQQAPAPVIRGSTAAGAAAADDAALTASAILRGVAISPRKLNMFAKLLRGLHLEDALIQCRMHPKKSARICEKVLLSARANATNNQGLDASRLKVEEAWVGRGTHLKRISIHARGRSGTKHKYRSHLTVLLKEGDAPRRVRVIPMLQERQKTWDMREGRDGDGKWWNWWPKNRLPPHVQAARAAGKGSADATAT